MNKDKRTYKLITPVEFAGETIAELSFRRPLGKDILDMDLKEVQKVGDMVGLAAKLSETIPPAFDGMEPDDILNIVEIANQLLGGGPTTGGSS